ncbi:hypothetical protein FHR84_003339 [Actinopolyspora biskrensis]|uniref:Transposase IS701-like DDE domain-containing protein n=1 Tax=Actinopolyspora biskrensis TaxID=1470178 RepID=A0A852Z1D0_9ACTN|nr:transposase [Actinopolyspora biskrensis]NYH79990.1 hypothetical protein [Actinopolyspora biskrensis]
MNVVAVRAEEVVDELCANVFSALSRSDQRRRGQEYVLGLLSTTGRRSIRNMATGIGGAAAAQRLHHFVHGSTWDWMAVRNLLVRYLRERVRPLAWVVSPLSIPKAGDHSVGVSTTSSSQRAFGLWMVTEDFAVPVNWRLFLSPEWTDDRSRRGKAGIPPGLGNETSGQCAANVVLEAVRAWGTLGAPVIFDNAEAEIDLPGSGLATAEFPYLLRVPRSARFSVADPSLPGYGSGTLPAQRLLDSVRGLRRAVGWTDPLTGESSTTQSAAVRVGSLHERRGTYSPGSTGRPLRLLGEWADPQRPPAHMWLTNAPTPPVETLLRSTKLAGRASGDARAVGDEVGMRDFEGRSFPGWHRHITLVSIAHAARVLSRDRAGEPDQVPPLPV